MKKFILFLIMSLFLITNIDIKAENQHFEKIQIEINCEFINIDVLTFDNTVDLGGLFYLMCPEYTLKSIFNNITKNIQVQNLNYNRYFLYSRKHLIYNYPLKYPIKNKKKNLAFKYKLLN